jgi:hypothetical protein
VLEQICDRITSTKDVKDKRPPIVAFGDGLFSSSSRYHAPAPVKGVRKALRRKGIPVFDIDESFTSQLCNSCHNKVVPMRCERIGGVRGKEIWGVRRCNSANCERNALNRDVNAAINILHIFTHAFTSRERPYAFTFEQLITK